MAGKRFATFSVFALLALALAVLASSGSEAQSYEPFTSYSLSDTTPEAASDSSISFTIPAPDYNYADAMMVSFAPPDGWTAPAATLPIGAGVGVLNAIATTGILNGPCATQLPPSFPLYNASVDISDELGPDDMNWILRDKNEYPIPDTDGDGLEDYLESYPYFLNEMLDPDGDGPQLPLQPRARYAGHSFVANMNVLIQFLVFEPGQLSQLPAIYAQMGAEYGYPTYIVLNNPVRWAEPGPFSDFCSPLETTATLYGITTDNPATAADEAGYESRRNPTAATGILFTGTHMTRNYSQSERDADGDGIENDLDPCPYSPDPLWDPRGPNGPPPCLGDNDCDGLPATCDPNDASFNADQDNDGYNNRQDNCPLVANGCQDISCGPIWSPAWDNQADGDSGQPNDDLGPGPDAIGDACDDSDDDGNEDGAGPGTCNDGIDNGPDGLMDVLDPDCASAMDDADPDPWGTNPGTGLFFHAMPWSAVCVGGWDSDLDGYCDDLEWILGSDPGNGSEYDLDPGLCGGSNCCDNAADDDGDTYVNDGCPMVGDYIESGWQCTIFDNISDDTPTPDATEQAIGAQVNDGCPVIGVPESLVIDHPITAGPTALPQADVAQSCSDGVDNDGDGSTDFDSQMLGCDPLHPSYDGDGDYDGVPDLDDNCPAVWNPEQTDTDLALENAGASVVGDGVGDACDSDDDNDGFSDAIENYLGTDPVDNCPNVIGAHDAWPLDISMDTFVSVVGDVLLGYRGHIAMYVSDNWALARLDLNGDGVINILGDVLHYVGMIGTNCDGGTFHSYTWPGTPVTMGIDPEITGNSAETLGDLEACVRIDVDPGDFGDGVADHTLDVYVTDAEGLDPTGYDAWVVYDPDRVDPVTWDDLIKLPDAWHCTGKTPPQLMAAAAYMYPEDSGIPGDGTLVRIDLDVKSAGAACFGFGFAKAYSSVTVVHPAVTRAASLAINADCAAGDSDGDTMIDMCDNCRDLSNAGQEDFDGDRWGDDCDNCPTTPTPWFVPVGDDDCDGFTNAVEEYLGTDPFDPCPDDPGDDAWPLDMDRNKVINLGGDAAEYYGNIGCDVGINPECKRLDLDANGVINLGGDAAKYYGRIGDGCT